MPSVQPPSGSCQSEGTIERLDHQAAGLVPPALRGIALPGVESRCWNPPEPGISRVERQSAIELLAPRAAYSKRTSLEHRRCVRLVFVENRDWRTLGPAPDKGADSPYSGFRVGKASPGELSVFSHWPRSPSPLVKGSADRELPAGRTASHCLTRSSGSCLLSSRLCSVLP